MTESREWWAPGLSCQHCGHTGRGLYLSAMLGGWVCDNAIACHKRATKWIGAKVVWRQRGGTWVAGTVRSADGQYRTIETANASGIGTDSHEHVHVSQIHGEGS